MIFNPTDEDICKLVNNLSDGPKVLDDIRETLNYPTLLLLAMAVGVEGVSFVRGFVSAIYLLKLQQDRKETSELENLFRDSQ